MNRMNKAIRLIFILALVFICTTCLNGITYAENTVTGTCGDNAFWEYNKSNGRLHIYGNGAITENPFYEYSDDIYSIIIDYGITDIKKGFMYYTNLTEISIPDSVQSMCSLVFYACRGLSEVELPDNIASIEQNSFAYCRGLKKIKLPKNLKTIGYGAFESCNNLTSISIPNKVETIDNGAFVDCTSLTTVNLSKSIRSIGAFAFFDCDKISDVYYDGNQNEWNAINIKADNESLQEANIHYIPAVAQYDTYTITDLSKTTNGIKMSVHSNATSLDTQQAIVACYNNGILTDVEIKTISPSDSDQIITFDIDTTNATLIKGFIWNNTKKLLSVSNVYSLEQ